MKQINLKEKQDSLRKKFFESNVEYLVVKNTLLKIASGQNKISLGDELFSGSTAIAISYDEPVLAAKVIKGFLEDHDLPIIKAFSRKHSRKFDVYGSARYQRK